MDGGKTNNRRKEYCRELLNERNGVEYENTEILIEGRKVDTLEEDSISMEKLKEAVKQIKIVKALQVMKYDLN